MARNSLTDIAFQTLKETGNELPFNKLWLKVSTEFNFSEEVGRRKIGSFYNALMMDARFISLENNEWDLRERHAQDTLKIDPDLVIDYDEDEEEFEEVLDVD